MNDKALKSKRYSITAMVAVCAVLAGVLTMRLTAKRMTRELLQITQRTTTVLTTQAQKDADDVPDPRLMPEEAEETPTSDDELLTDATTEAPTTAPTTAPPTTQAAATVQAATPSATYILPLKEADIAKAYAPDTLVYSETMHDWRTHNGIDFSAAEGSEVLSVGEGKVTKVISDVRLGYTVEADYGAFTARYCGLSQEGAAHIDAVLHTGDVIGVLDTVPLESGDGAHLHFEVVQNGVRVDPLEALGLEE